MERNGKEIRQRIPFNWMPVIELKELGYCQHPKPSDPDAIGYDLYVPESIIIEPHSRTIVPTNVSLNLPPCVEAKVEPRSGYSAKGMEGFGTRKVWGWVLGVIPWRFTEVGVMRFNADVINGKIDPGYKGNIGVIVKNDDDRGFIIQEGTRIAQLTFYRTLRPKFKVVDELSCADRGGGYGHSNETDAK